MTMLETARDRFGAAQDVRNGLQRGFVDDLKLGEIRALVIEYRGNIDRLFAAGDLPHAQEETKMFFDDLAEILSRS